VPWHEDGYLFLTGQPEIMAKLEAAAALQRSMGLTDVHVLTREQIREVVPWVDPQGLLGATHTPHDGRMTPTDGVAALARAARGRGVRHREHWRVTGLERSGSAYRLVGPSVVEAERVVLCTGFWSSELLKPFGLELTVRPMPSTAPSRGPRSPVSGCR